MMSQLITPQLFCIELTLLIILPGCVSKLSVEAAKKPHKITIFPLSNHEFVALQGVCKPWVRLSRTQLLCQQCRTGYRAGQQLDTRSKI